MTKLRIRDGVLEDLAEIKNINREDALFIATLIQSLKEDESLLDKLIRPGDIQVEEDIQINVCHLSEVLRSHGICLSRIKIIDMPRPRGPKSYRIIFAFDGKAGDDIYYILGVMNRSTNYAINSPIFARIIADYDEIGLARIRPIGR